MWRVRQGTGTGTRLTVRDIAVHELSDYVFCPRRAWLGAQGFSVPHEDLVRGKYAHRKVDEETDTTSVQVYDIDIGLYGRADVVAADDACSVELVEYKSARKQRGARDQRP
jgi:CRISP-associated protein Cas1